jgi:hypothetical protein
MNVHMNARPTSFGRERIVRQIASGQTAKAAADVGLTGGAPAPIMGLWLELRRGIGTGARRGSETVHFGWHLLDRPLRISRQSIRR